MAKSILILLFIFFIGDSIQKADVYFTQYITKSNIVKMFQKLNVKLSGKIGLKVHSGEVGGKYFLSPNLLQKIHDYTKGTFIECNTAYQGGRYTTESHKQLLKDHGWLDNGRRTIIMDEDPSEDFNLTIENPVMIDRTIVGGHLKDFDSCIVLSHFKGHPMGGFGGALKQLSIGFASRAGKAWIHAAGNLTNRANQENFTASMGDAASSIVKYFREKGGIVFINVLANISLWCDCAGGNAPAPKIHDMGILASTDPVALDRACLDMIANHTDDGTVELLGQIDRLLGENTIYVAERHKIGSQEYNFINITNETDQYDKDDDDGNGNEVGSGSKTWVIIIIIVIILIIALAILAFYFFKNKKNQNDLDLIEKKVESEAEGIKEE